jgi:hypothetical protein
MKKWSRLSRQMVISEVYGDLVVLTDHYDGRLNKVYFHTLLYS